MWGQISQATGAKFDAYIGQTSPGDMYTQLNRAQQLAQQGVLNAMEGGNEEDDTGPQAAGNSLGQTAAFQQTLYSAAHAAGLPAINMSFGAGWTAANNWQGNYGAVGDLSSIADYANAHTYPMQGAPDQTILQLNDDAHLAAASRPVIATEFGLAYENTQDPTQLAKYALDGVFDGMKDGVVRTYFYALFNDNSGNFGIMNPDGSPTAAGTALHNLTTLLQDGGAASPGSLSYSLSGTQGGDNTLLMQKSDGTYWLAAWNESGSPHDVTLNLGSAASQVQVFDPLTGTGAVQTANGTNSVTFTMQDHPELLEITPSGAPAPTPVAATSPAPAAAAPDPAAAPPAAAPATPAADPSATAQATAPQLVQAADQAAPATAAAPVAQQTGVSPTPPATSGTINGSGDGTIVSLQGSTLINIGDGNPTAFVGGTGNVVDCGAGTDTVMAFDGGNFIQAGSGSDTIRIAGSGNTVVGGTGNSTIEDSGSGNVIALSQAGQGTEQIYGYVLEGSDTFDLRNALAGTTWNHDVSTIGNYLQVSQSGNDAVISIDPTGNGGSGAGSAAVAVLHGEGAVGLPTLLSHSLVA